jgi:hypothetical protein
MAELSQAQEEIQEMLKGYVPVTDMSTVQISTHIRYFSKNNNGDYVFRTGGWLKSNTSSHTFIVLSNGESDWSVQVKNSKFFRKLSREEEQEITT